MSDNEKKPRAIRPGFLMAMGLALAVFGLISGMALDLSMRPSEPPASRAPSQRSPAITEVPGDIRPEPPIGEPVRAWAPETPAEDRPMVAFAVRSPAAS